MIRVNLLPIKELEAESARKREVTIGGVVLGITGLLLLGGYFYQAQRLSSLESENTQIRGEIQALDAKVREIGELQNKIKAAKAKNQALESLNRKKAGPVRVMLSLASATPNKLWLTELIENGGSMTINGLAVDNKTVADFLRDLERLDMFTNVELVETTRGGKDQEQYKKFSIRAGISYQGQNQAAKNSESTPGKKEIKG